MDAHMPLDIMMSWLMAPCFVVRYPLPLKLIMVMLIVYILLRIFTVSVDLTAIVPLKVFKTDLDRLHLFQKMLNRRSVQSWLKVYPIGNVSELGQV